MKTVELPSLNHPKYMKLEEDPSKEGLFAKFTMIGEPLPFTVPNIPTNTEVEELSRIIGTSDSTMGDWCCGCCCCFSMIGSFYFCKKLILIPSGSYGFAMNSGVPQLLRPGWHFLGSPLKSLYSTIEMSTNPIIVGPVTIVRIPQGCIGTATDNTKLELLLPGTHCRNSGTFKYDKTYPLNNNLVEFRQIKILTILTGSVQICYDVGRAAILKEGKYAVNSPSFIIGPSVSIQQQSLQFSKHNVLLDGGIQMTVEGLLTFQIADVEKMLHNLGADQGKLIGAIQNVTKAEISKIFSAIHLEQISSISHEEAINPKAHKVHEKMAELITDSDNIQNEIRIKICEQVVILIKPLLEDWGVKVINFQMESIKLTDEKYGMEYEAASLEIAKAKANLKANVARNEINISKAEMEAKALLIKVEGEKNAKIVAAEGIAKAMTIEAQARNEAAQTLQDNFSKDLLMMQEKVNFARELKATTLVISDQNTVAKNVVPMLNL
jgi:regulator of protease activity HflC (stomatin/prohibitin superfamily)